MRRSKSGGEAAMFVGAIQPKTRIIAAGIVTDPAAVIVYMWGFGMTLAIAEIARFGDLAMRFGLRLPGSCLSRLLARSCLRRCLPWRFVSYRGRTVRRNVSSAHSASALFLRMLLLPVALGNGCPSAEGTGQNHCSYHSVHVFTP